MSNCPSLEGIAGWGTPYSEMGGMRDVTPTVVFRVEDRDGNGPYCYGRSVLDHHRFGAGPPLHLDLPFECCNCHFPHWQTSGFARREDAEWWFQGMMPWLEDRGFRLVEYLVPRDAITHTKSGRQVAFDKDAAELMYDWPDEQPS